MKKSNKISMLNDIELQLIDIMQSKSNKHHNVGYYGTTDYSMTGLNPDKMLRRHSYARFLKLLADANRPLHRWEFFGKKMVKGSRWCDKLHKCVPCMVDENRGRGVTTFSRLWGAGLIESTKLGYVLTDLGILYSKNILPKLIAA